MSTVLEEMTETFRPAELKTLADERANCFVTLLLPTHRHSPDYKQDSIRLKNLVAKAESALPAKFAQSGLLDNVRQRISDELFWQHQLDGLAVFITPATTRYRQLPHEVLEGLYVSDHPLIRPLVPRCDRIDSASILSLTWESSQRFSFRGTDRRVDVTDDDHFPIRFEQIVGERDAETQLQYHSQRQRGGGGDGGATEAAIYHGHGSGERQIDADRKHYLTAVATAFEKQQYGISDPQVIVGTEEVLGHFKAVANHDDFVEVTGSPAEFTPQELGERVANALADMAKSREEEIGEAFGQALSSENGSVHLTKIYDAARQGRVERLLLLDSENVWATRQGDDVTVLQEGSVKTPQDASHQQFELVNAAVIETLKHGGSVVQGNPQILNSANSPAAATFRY